MQNLEKLTTPDEYINYYSNQLISELDKKDLKISMVGTIGFLLNLFGWTQFDIKSYYDYIFKELHPISSDEDENLLLHSSLYGYIPTFATNATIVGRFKLNFDKFPIKSTSTIKRQININNIKININGIIYSLTSKYTIIDSGGNSHSCQIVDSDGYSQLLPISLQNETVIIKNLDQYTENIITFKSPSYVFGTHYTYDIILNENEQLVSIDVFVNDEEYNIRNVKWFTESDEKVVFLRQINTNQMIIELGSGVTGKYIPNSEIRIITKVTKGTLGNISNSIVVKPFEGNIIIYDEIRKPDNSIELVGPIKIDVNQSINVEVDYALNGKNALSGESLRLALIKYIQSRDNLISEKDFINILSNYFTDYYIIFKKLFIESNIIYLYTTFLNKDYTYIKTLTHTPLLEIFENFIVDDSNIIINESNINTKIIYKPEFSINNKTYISPFLYVYNTYLDFYKTYIVNDNVNIYFSKIEIYLNNEFIDTNDINMVPPPITINIEFNKDTLVTLFNISSYEVLNEDYNKITISSNLLDFKNIELTGVENIYTYTYNKLLMTEFDINIKLYNDDANIMINYYNDNIKIINETTDIFTTRTYVSYDNNTYVVGIPVIEKSVYISDSSYYNDKVIELYSIILNKENRMISDDIELRFFNTSFIDKSLLHKLTSSKNKNDILDITSDTIELPFIFRIDMVFDKNKVIQNKINMDDIIYGMKLEIAKILKNNYTGNRISFYNTTIIDMIYSFNSIKNIIKSIDDIFIYGSNNTFIPNSDLETIDQHDLIKSEEVSKELIVSYCPVYFYWDLNNIVINYELK